MGMLGDRPAWPEPRGTPRRLPDLPGRRGDEELHEGRRLLRRARTGVVVVGVALVAAAAVTAGRLADVVLR